MVTFSQIDFGPRAALATDLWTAANQVAAAHSLAGTPFHEGGNFFTATWCSPASLERCSRGLASESGMTLRFQAVRFVQQPFQAVGLSFAVTDLPSDRQAWGATAGFTDSDAVVSGSFGAGLVRNSARDHVLGNAAGPLPAEDSFTVGDALAYEVGLGNVDGLKVGVVRPMTTVRITSDLSPVDQVKAFKSSDAAMTARMKERLAKLRTEVLARLDRHEAKVCTVGAHAAVPPPCPQRDMTPAEEAAAKAVATAHFDQQDALLEREHGAIFAAVDQLFPWASAIR